MQLKKQVCNQVLSKRLAELGVKQESLFWWKVDLLNDGQNTHICFQDKITGNLTWDFYSAFTVAELGEMLPDDWYTYHQTYEGGLNLDKGRHWFGSQRGTELMEHALTEADARAKMLIYLLENGLVTSAETGKESNVKTDKV